jgi:hypothetical protein
MNTDDSRREMPTTIKMTTEHFDLTIKGRTDEFQGEDLMERVIVELIEEYDPDPGKKHESPEPEMRFYALVLSAVARRYAQDSPDEVPDDLAAVLKSLAADLRFRGYL